MVLWLSYKIFLKRYHQNSQLWLWQNGFKQGRHHAVSLNQNMVRKLFIYLKEAKEIGLKTTAGFQPCFGSCSSITFAPWCFFVVTVILHTLTSLQNTPVLFSCACWTNQAPIPMPGILLYAFPPALCTHHTPLRSHQMWVRLAWSVPTFADVISEIDHDSKTSAKLHYYTEVWRGNCFLVLAHVII